MFNLIPLLLSWVKFYSIDGNHIVAAWVATGLLIPIIFVFIAFAAHFYLKVYTGGFLFN